MLQTKFVKSLLIALCTCCCLTYAADLVILNNDDEIEGDIVQEDRAAIVLKLSDGSQRSIRRNEIRIVVYDRNKRKNEPGTRPVIQGEAFKAEPPATTTEDSNSDPASTPDADAAKTDDAEKPAAKPESSWPKVPPETESAFNNATNQLASTDPSERNAGKAAVRALGQEALPLLVTGLQHANLFVRSACADLIAEAGARETIKFLIEAFYSAMPESGQAATYQRNYLRSLKTALERTTGQSFINVEVKSELVQLGLKQYIDWYNENIDRLSPQLGEPEFDPTEKDYLQKIKEARALKLEKRAWPRPPLSADMAAGEGKQQGFTAENLTREVDKRYREEFPSKDRESAGGYFRESDRKYGDEFFRR